MLRGFRTLLAGGLLAASLGDFVAVAAEPTVILLSWDGMRHDHPERGDFPALARIEREGVRAEGLVPPFPSNTFPGHVTLATGTHPDRHGIVNNRFRDPERGRFDYSNDASWIEAEPLWAAAERQGVRSAVFFWVGSETDWRGRGASLRRTPFNARVSEREKVKQLLAWLDLPQRERPRLLMAWWHGADTAAHRHGPDAPEVSEQLAAQDAELKRLLEGLDARGLWDSTTLLIVGDHGMARGGRDVDVRAALRAAGVRAQVETGGAAAHVYLDEPADREAARRALAVLPGVAVYAAGEIPPRLRIDHPRSGDLLLVAEPPGRFAASGGSWRERFVRWLGRGPGVHGYDPQHAEMASVFLALGRGAPAGTRLGRLHAVDVAPSVAALLGIEPPSSSEGVARLPVAAP